MTAWPMLRLPGHLAGHTITRYLAAELPTAETERAQRHLLGCARCARRCEEQQLAHHLVRRLPLDRPLSPTARDTLQRQLASAAHPPRPAPLRFLSAAARARAVIRPTPPSSRSASAHGGSSFWAVAAVLVVALASALLFGPLSPHAHPPPASTALAGVPAGWECAPPTGEDLANPAAWSRAHMTLNAVTMVSATEGWAVGEYVGSRGAIVTDAGGSWLLDYTTPPGVLRGISLDDPGDGWAVGEDCTRPGHALLVHLSGSTWTQVDGSAFGALSSVAMRSATDGWAAGPHTLLHYDGSAWTPVPLPQGMGATGLALPSTTSGWAVGANGTILRGDGQGWTSVAGGNGPDLNAVTFASANEGWAVGGYPGADGPGALAHYTHGQWSLVGAPVAGELFGVCMLSPVDGWAVGGMDVGVVLHYSGGHWRVFPTTGLPGLRALALVSPTEGWAVGREGALIHFHNGAWDEQLRALW